MVGFGRAMGFGKVDQLNIATPLGNSLNAFVNVDRACLASMVRAQLAQQVRRQGVG
jgi:uncharacterized protein YhhL (DUF1145 family)